MNQTRVRFGFTLVELLVVIAIIGILMGLLLPAVQQAREAARSAQCSNHLKQLSLAAINYESVQKIYPTGGWGWHMIGDADRGAGLFQPGSWQFCILPQLEQNALFQLSALGENTAGTPSGTKKANGEKLITTPMPIFNCPSRRRSKVYSLCSSSSASNIFNSNIPPKVVRGDYAANYGSQDCSCEASALVPETYQKAQNYNWGTSSANGLFYQYSEISSEKVYDGLSNTFLFGEKYVPTNHYETGQYNADNEGLYFGCDNDNQRGSYSAPRQDRSGYTPTTIWGSAHAGSFKMSVCDGSVRAYSYITNINVLRNLGNREDGNATGLR